MGLGLPQAADSQKPVRHKIADGDTLTALAERYLGSADRAKEIFEANRDVLSSPDILPIGTELKIPPRCEPEPAAPEMTPQGPLVPIPHPSGRP